MLNFDRPNCFRIAFPISFVLSSKIENVLRKIEDQEKYEQENPNLVSPLEKVLAIGRNTGIFYNILLQNLSASKVLEIGTSIGYSTIWFAEAISKSGGKIITIEKNEKKIMRAKKNFDDAGVNALIEIHHGDALKIISKLKNEHGSFNSFDFIFIDADKERYIQYFDAVLPLVRPRGLIGADNILYPERFQKFTNPYVNHVRQTPNIKSVTIPIDNGEELSLKLS